MATKEKPKDKDLTPLEHNDAVWKEVKALEAKIAELKETLKPAVLPKQADLNHCNMLARKAKVEHRKINPKLVAEESGLKSK